MAQLSRTYQVVLILVAVLALAWFTVLHNQISSSSGGSSSTGAAQSAHPSSQGQGSSHAPQAGSVSQSEGTPTRVYHGPVPGLKGLSKSIRRAHEAVGTANAQSSRLEAASGSKPAPTTQSASSSAAGAHGKSTGAATRSSSSHSSSSRSAAAGGVSHAASGGSPAAGARPSQGGSRALTVGRQLHQGKVVLLLFWKSKSFDDQAVHAQVLAASRSLRRGVATDFAKPSEVSAFGSVTADVGVLQTPTLLLINHKGLVTTITGLTDAFAIEQAVREAR